MERQTWRVMTGLLVLGAAWGCESTSEPENLPPTCTMAPGELIITEVMARPAVPAPESGRPRVEWFELFNAALEPRSWKGLILEAGTPSRPKVHRVPDAWAPTQGPGEFLVVGNGFLGDGITGYAWPEMVLADDGAILTLRCGDQVIDQVVYGAGSPGPGKGLLGRSWQLSSRVFSAGMDPDPSVNEVPESWCLSGPEEVLDEDGNQGTPGGPNRACLLPGECRDLDGYRPVRAPSPGDLVLTEWFADPKGTDASREWFEWLARRDVDLNGVVLDHQVDQTVRTIRHEAEACLSLKAGEYVVIGESLLPEENGGLTGVFWSPGPFELYNDQVTVTWRAADGTPLGIARIPKAVSGVAMSLDPGFIDTPEAWQDRTHWCPSQVQGLFEGRGSPGQPNETCP